MKVHVTLANGRDETLSLPEDSTARDLKIMAQAALDQKFLKLVTVAGHVLADPFETLQAAGIKDGDCLTAISIEVNLVASQCSFALCVGGQVTSWGNPSAGGDSSRVKERLSSVTQLQSTMEAFAAILEDGSVVTWGNEWYGAECSKVHDQLKGVLEIKGTKSAFAAILTDGSVVAWGDADYGGDCSKVQEQLKGVRKLQATGSAFVDENELGIVAIAAGDRTLLLKREQRRPKREIEVVSVIRNARKSVPECKVLVKSPEKPKQAKEGGGEASRERSRSPNRKSPEPQFPFSDKFETLDCGGNGDCGYLCLAAGMGFDRGETWEDLQPHLLTRSRTIRNDIYKHLTSGKHEADYKTFFSLELLGDEHHEAGALPTDWQSWTQSTLRPHRWIDGLSIQAACKRYGLHVIIVPSKASACNQPLVFGSPRSGRPPIVLLLHHGHYQLAKLLPGKQWPREFLEADGATVSSKIFRGGGKSSTESVGSWRPMRTPDAASRVSWRPVCTPSNKSSSKSLARWRPAVTPKSSRLSSRGARPTIKAHSKAMPPTSRKAAAASSCLHSAESRPKTARPSAASSDGVQETFVWVCNLCEQVFRYGKKHVLRDARRRHIAKAHPTERSAVHTCSHRGQKVLVAEATDLIPLDQRAWTCPKCGKGIAYLPQRALKQSREAHVMKCYGYTKAKLSKLCYKSPIWKSVHASVVQSNATKKLEATDTALAEYNQARQASAFRIPHLLGTARMGGFSCNVCTVIFQHFHGATGLKEHKCTGRAGREKVLASPGRKKIWCRLRLQKDKTGVTFLMQNWQITLTELQIMERRLQNVPRVPPLTKCQWIRDLCAEGIEPNPGPSCKRRALQGWSVNADGKAGAWAVARWVCHQRPELCVVQEVSMNAAEFADLSRFMQRHGYRAWNACPPPVLGANGRYYCRGGVCVFVRGDKPAFQVRKMVYPGAQATMIQLDHAFIVGVYLSPQHEEEARRELDEWVVAVAADAPIVLIGDFNHTPEFASRWTALRDAGNARYVQDANGQPVPTRWTGNRCIDWAWCSHPCLVSQLTLGHVAFADHKPFGFQLRFGQSIVHACKPVPTRNLLPAVEQVQEWKAALKDAWQEVEAPSRSSVEVEWQEFCTSAERCHERALEVCQAKTPRPCKHRAKGSPMKVQAIDAKTFRLTQQATFRELRLRKLLGRIAEAREQERRGRPVPAKLSSRVWSHPFLQGMRFHNLQEAHAWAEDSLRDHVKLAQQNRINEWRAKVRCSLAEEPLAG